MLKILGLFIAIISFSSCTQEFQNQVSRDVQNWTGANGVLDIVSAGKVMYRFIDVDKVSAAKGTGVELDESSIQIWLGCAGSKYEL